MNTKGVRRRWADRVLLVSAVLYTFVFIGQFYTTAVWYEALYWVVQSALIGSVADWFAVTALFRKPLGVSYHTELIPRNKDRLIEGIAQLADTKLLTLERCKMALATVRFMPLLDRYITGTKGRAQLQSLLQIGLLQLWQQRTQAEWAKWGGGKLRSILEQQSIVGPLQQWLLAVCRENRHEAIIIKWLDELQQQLDRPGVIQWVTNLIDEEIQKKKDDLWKALIIGLSEATDIINARDMAVSLLHELHRLLERWKQPGSRERLVWMQQWVIPIETMAYNSTVTGTIDKTFRQWIAEENWEQVILTYVCPYVDELVTKETPAAVLEQSLQELWKVYGSRPQIRKQLEAACHRLAEYVLYQGHALIGVIVRQVLKGLSTERFIYFIESKVEDDLSWIRINGALVGAACGLGVWGFLHIVYEPIVHILGI